MLWRCVRERSFTVSWFPGLVDRYAGGGGIGRLDDEISVEASEIKI